jgi:hypothetical protein
MLHHSINDVRVLARTYLEATGIGASTLSRKITGAPNNHEGSQKLVPRLLAGKSCRAESLELASNWFQENWPSDVPWPLEQGQPDIDKLRSAAQ